MKENTGPLLLLTIFMLCFVFLLEYGEGRGVILKEQASADFVNLRDEFIGGNVVHYCGVDEANRLFAPWYRRNYLHEYRLIKESL